jgi:F0F1-type ATP synthase assembly protein I|tara:strand:+ start:57 stop:311 length:255 start_codon:yes stop_codon:yes gene_type:complete
MEHKILSEWSDEKLLQKIKNLKSSKIIDATLIGLTIGIFIYSLVNNGFGFSTFFPLIIGYLIIKSSKNNKVLEKEILKEIKSRK